MPQGEDDYSDLDLNVLIRPADYAKCRRDLRALQRRLLHGVPFFTMRPGPAEKIRNEKSSLYT